MAKHASEPSRRGWAAILVRAGKESLQDHVTNLAAALAYYAFLAIPSVLLVVVGIFSLTAGEPAVGTIIDKLEGVVPEEVLTLVRDSLLRVTQNTAGSGIALTVIGSVLALWTLTGAMQTLMWALNSAYDHEETRGLVKRRLIALAMVVLMLLAFGLVFGLLVLGPALSDWIGSAVDQESFVDWLWWTAQWPILILGLLFAFSVILYLGPGRRPQAMAAPRARDVDQRRRLAGRFGRIRLLRQPIRLLQQGLGVARGGDHHAHLALDQRAGAPVRCRDQRRGRAEPGVGAFSLRCV